MTQKSRKILRFIKKSLERIDHKRDQLLFIFIKAYWPRKITPNHLTTIRMIIGFFLFILLFYLKTPYHLLVVALFLVAALTDLFDGSVARALHEETHAGAIFDPVADRILIFPIAVYFLFDLHRWLFLTIILLEIINGLISSYGHSKQVLPKANIFGKTKMVLQCLIFAWILIFWSKNLNLFITSLLWLSLIFLILSIIVEIAESRRAFLVNSIKKG